jgi:hypothetical protein
MPAAGMPDLSAIELTEQMTAEVRNELSRYGISREFRVAHNRAIPFPLSFQSMPSTTKKSKQTISPQSRN